MLKKIIHTIVMLMIIFCGFYAFSEGQNIEGVLWVIVLQIYNATIKFLQLLK